MNWSDSDVEQALNAIALANAVEDFQNQVHPVFYRNEIGQLVPAKRWSKEAGFGRCPRLGNQLIKL